MTQQAEPVAQAKLPNLAQAGIASPTDVSGTTQAIPAILENGSDSAAVVEALETGGFAPSIATECQWYPVPQDTAPETPITV